MNKIVIQSQDFDLSTEVSLARKNNSNIGAVVSFIGTVRDLDKQPILKMTLEHYPGMTEKALTTIANSAKNRWPLEHITIIHRVGELAINDQIVLVITASKHRQAAFESCEFMMDLLKTQAPFWKKEHSLNSSHWVQSNNKDAIKANNWD